MSEWLSFTERTLVQKGSLEMEIPEPRTILARTPTEPKIQDAKTCQDTHLAPFMNKSAPPPDTDQLNRIQFVC